MNLEQVRNPHRIYPGQTLYLEKVDGLARLRMGQPPAGAVPIETVRVSPRTRISALVDTSIPTLPPHLIEPFLNEAILVEDAEILNGAPRIVAVPEDRVLITQGDRAYARGMSGAPLVNATRAWPTTSACSATPRRCAIPARARCWATKPSTSAARSWCAARASRT
jgi:hypothetical protein